MTRLILIDSLAIPFDRDSATLALFAEMPDDWQLCVLVEPDEIHMLNTVRDWWVEDCNAKQFDPPAAVRAWLDAQLCGESWAEWFVEATGTVERAAAECRAEERAL